VIGTGGALQPPSDKILVMVQQSEIDVIDAGGVAMVVLRGEFDAATSTDVDAALAGALNGDRTVVDLHAVTFVDSTVMSTFLIAQRRAEEANVRHLPAGQSPCHAPAANQRGRPAPLIFASSGLTGPHDPTCGRTCPAATVGLPGPRPRRGVRVSAD
jgi:hypothetical protein